MQPRAVDERPWPVPARPWALAMRWHDLLFAHWRIDAAQLEARLPAGLELDRFDGDAWIAVVPFRMSNVRPRGVPSLPWFSAFPELNVRTYVTCRDKPGVWFFSLDAANPVAVRVARATFGLPYFDARMRCQERNGAIEYSSTRTHRGAPAAEFAGRYRPTGPLFHAKPGSLEHFLTARFCLYTVDRDGRLLRGEIDHSPWPLALAEAEFERNTLLASHGVTARSEAPLLHFAKKLDVGAWRPVPV